jgi:hypothetical protein
MAYQLLMSMNLVAGTKKDVLARTHQTQRRPSPGRQKFRSPDIWLSLRWISNTIDCDVCVPIEAAS